MLHKEVVVGNRRLYESRAFEVKEVLKHDGRGVWHLIGEFVPGAVKSVYKTVYSIRVAPDTRWEGVTRVSFRADRIYESESIASTSRRRVYGSGRWYVSPYFDGPRGDMERLGARDKFSYEDFEVG